MKKFFSLFLTAALPLVALTSCGGGGDSKNSEEAPTANLAYNQKGENDFSQILTPDSTGALTAKGNLLEFTVKFNDIKQSDDIVDYTDVYVDILDANDNVLAKLHGSGGFIELNKAITSGDTSKCESIRFIEYVDSNEKADEIIKNAKSFTLTLPIVDPSVLEERFASSSSSSSHDDSEYFDGEEPESPKVKRCIQILLEQVQLAKEFHDASGTDKKIEIIKKYMNLEDEDDRIFYDELHGSEVSQYHKFRDKIIESPEVEPLWKELREAVDHYRSKGTLD